MSSSRQVLTRRHALTGALLAVLKTGDEVLAADCVYRPSRRFCDTVLKRFGVATRYFDPALAPEAVLAHPNKEHSHGQHITTDLIHLWRVPPDFCPLQRRLHCQRLSEAFRISHHMHKLREHLWCESEAISSIPELLKFQSRGLMLCVL